MEKEHVGKLLKRIRSSKRITVNELARLTGIDRVYLQKLESGTPKTITLDTAKKLAKGLGVRPEIFLSSEDSEGFYFSAEIFEIMVKEIRERYHISGDKKIAQNDK